MNSDVGLSRARGATKAGEGPKYLPVYEKLRARFEGGEFAVGALLPVEDELCAEFGVSRYTLREALRVLEQQGFIQRRRRAGTKVLSPPASNVFRHAIGSRGDLLDYVSGTSIRFGSPRLIETDGKLARLLGCDELRQWHLLEGVRVDTATQRPIGVTQLYIDASRATPPADGDFGHKPVYEWLEETQGVRAETVSQDVSAVLLNTREGDIFGEVAGAPALRVVRRYFDGDLKIFQITVTTHRSEDFVYNIRFQLA